MFLLPLSQLFRLFTATTRRDQFLMKLRPEYESVRSSLLNRSPVPSLDICFGELLREEQRLSTQAILEQSHGSSGKATVAYACQGRGPPMHSKTCSVFAARNMGILLPLALRSFVLIAKRRVDSLWAKIRKEVWTACGLKKGKKGQQSCPLTRFTWLRRVSTYIAPGTFSSSRLQYPH
ncbi:hypothetical protein CK203_108895 [Vitis vinifera]|uniref:Uncharacterized protein n=1 Tax=Vitis vinifera TaxID=29760 RepID=A0A438CS73_VITVI|nr:hypothetical protein CK203_108895 [Vitis vinifera]